MKYYARFGSSDTDSCYDGNHCLAPLDMQTLHTRDVKPDRSMCSNQSATACTQLIDSDPDTFAMIPLHTDGTSRSDSLDMQILHSSREVKPDRSMSSNQSATAYTFATTPLCTDGTSRSASVDLQTLHNSCEVKPECSMSSNQSATTHKHQCPGLWLEHCVFEDAVGP